MYRAVIFFFSGTGNTWWVADKIKKQMDIRGINADIVSIDSVDSKKANWWIKTADLVLFGWPVYCSDLPEPMKNFIDNLIAVEKGKHIHTFCTQMGFSGDGAYLYRRNFVKKGLVIDSAAHFTMPSNLSMYRGMMGPPDEAKIKDIMLRCEKEVEKYADRLLSGRTRIKGRFGGWMGLLQRAPYRHFTKKRLNSVNVDSTRCTRCGLCMTLCPMHNITSDEIPSFLGNCTQCLRCYAFCPTSAISMYGRLYDTKKKGRPYTLADKRFKPAMLRK